MKLKDLLKDIEYISNIRESQLEDIEISDIVYDSRKAVKDSIFVAIKGETVDGHDYIKGAYDKGSRVFIINHDLEIEDDAIKIIVPDSRRVLSRMSAIFFSEPTKKLKVVGITGTKGKTTISNYIKTVLTKSGMNTGVIGTNGVFYNDVAEKTLNTTPESYELQKTIKEMLDAGVECVAMEVSSSGLMMGRVDDIDFDIGVYTNLSPDHIGPKEHPTFEHYRECKSRLFGLCKYGIINVDDENAQYMVDHAKCPTCGFSIDKESDIKAGNIELTRSSASLGVDFDYKLKDQDTVRTHICSPGEFSIYNALAVIGVCDHFGIDRDKMLEALSDAKVDGRVEVIPVLDNATVILDYAHNGLSLENVLDTLLKYDHNRMICVYGSIGGRAAIRRKELGDVAARLCDVSIITTDNPDDEDPMKIIDEIAESYVGSDSEVHKVVDRAEAIYKALEMAEDGDMVLVTGKGHEKYQYIHGQRVFYDEKAEVIKAGKKVMENRSNR